MLWMLNSPTLTQSNLTSWQIFAFCIWLKTDGLYSLWPVSMVRLGCNLDYCIFEMNDTRCTNPVSFALSLLAYKVSVVQYSVWPTLWMQSMLTFICPVDGVLHSVCNNQGKQRARICLLWILSRSDAWTWKSLETVVNVLKVRVYLL